MTKEENIATLNEHLEHWKRLLSEKICDKSEGEKTIDALQNAIKALEQETCGDAISRQVVLEAIEDDNRNGHYSCFASNNDAECFKQVIRDLPSITSQPKMGKWLIKRAGDYNHAICSVCGDDSFLSPEWDALELYKYCPNCGAKMEVMQNDQRRTY